MPLDGLVPTALAQLCQVTAHTLGARQDDQVGSRDWLARANELQVHLRVQA